MILEVLILILEVLVLILTSWDRLRASWDRLREKCRNRRRTSPTSSPDPAPVADPVPDPIPAPVPPKYVAQADPVPRKYVTQKEFDQMLCSMLREARDQGHQTLEVRAGYLQKQVGVRSRVPMACNAMYKKLRRMGGSPLGGSIISSPPSGFGSSLTIEYNLSRLPPDCY